MAETAEAYARQKDAFVVEYAHVKHLHCLGDKRALRDDEITRHTPKSKVKEILLRRYYENTAV